MKKFVAATVVVLSFTVPTASAASTSCKNIGVRSAQALGPIEDIADAMESVLVSDGAEELLDACESGVSASRKLSRISGWPEMADVGRAYMKAFLACMSLDESTGSLLKVAGVKLDRQTKVVTACLRKK